jgi:hypothetical protein
MQYKQAVSGIWTIAEHVAGIETIELRAENQVAGIW